MTAPSAGIKYTGLWGYLKKGSTSIPVTNFEVTEEAKMAMYVDTTTGGFEDNEEGSHRWSGTFEMTEDPTLWGIREGQKWAAELYTGTEKLAGNVRVQQIPRRMDRKAEAILSYVVTFVGCGPCAKTSDLVASSWS